MAHDPADLAGREAARLAALLGWRSLIEKLGNGGNELRWRERLRQHDAVRDAFGCPIVKIYSAYVNDGKVRVDFSGVSCDVPPVELSRAQIDVSDECSIFAVGLVKQLDGILAGNDPMAMGAVDALKAANRKALVVGINASREAMDMVKSGDILGSGDYDTFAQGCLAVEMAVRSVRKQEVPRELILKPVVVDKNNYAPFDQPFENRECPTLVNVDRQK